MEIVGVVVEDTKITPMMQQYLEIKREYRECIIFYRLGEFYEMFFSDAIVASAELGIALTSRGKGEEKIPMCGVPSHSATTYIARLVKNGHKIAICDQVSDPKDSKGIVERKVVRVITPGTVLDDILLDDTKNNYIMCIYQGKKAYGLAISDITTGEFITTAIDDERRIIDEIAKFSPSEVLLNENCTLKSTIESAFDIVPHALSDWMFRDGNKKLCDHFEVINLEGFGLNNQESISASGALLEYLYETQMNRLAHIVNIRKYNIDAYMLLDISSRRNLELTKTLRNGDKKGSLLWVMDKTVTSMGARLLRKWIEQPLINVEAITRRLDAVEEYKNDAMLREELREQLKTVKDIERLMGKIMYNRATPVDLNTLKLSINNLGEIKKLLKGLKAPLSEKISTSLDELTDIFTLIDKNINTESTVNLKDGNTINLGINKDLDSYKEAKTKGNSWLLALEDKERASTGIKSLKIKHSKTFGYCFEVTNTYKNLVPDYFVRKQTLTTAERYVTEELKEIEEKILSANDKIIELEQEIFSNVISAIAKEVSRVNATASVIAHIDILQNFAEIADKNGYTKPAINSDGVLEIKEGRHPVVELLTKNTFIPNDVNLNNDKNRIGIITGPNMAGKSTYMRQVALIVLMAQMGSFVPAESASIGVVDRIFTRVGASDDLATGQSTFMVEMSEVANILNNATKHSLIILDEIGRGTSTFDGLSIAWSVVEYIADTILAKTLFATHYHELTEVEGTVEGVQNYCVAIKEVDNELVFLRKVKLGTVDKSYGIQVAKLAGIPADVIKRADDIMKGLVSQGKPQMDIKALDEGVYFSKKEKKLKYNVLKEIGDIDQLNEVSAIDILRKVKGDLMELFDNEED